jgi:4-hydroxybenzoate polyprenyltransferase
MKRITWWPQAWLGLTFNWGALMGFAAALGGSSVIQRLQGERLVGGTLNWWPAIALYGAGIAWTLGYDTIYAVQDLEGDAGAGVKSTARRLGARAPQLVSMAYIASLGLALTAGFLAHLGNGFTLLVFAQAAHFGWQGRRLDLRNPASALAVFRSNTLAGLILFAALVVGRFPAGG